MAKYSHKLQPNSRVEITFEGHDEKIVVEFGDLLADDGQRSVLVYKTKDDPAPECIYLSETDAG